MRLFCRHVKKLHGEVFNAARRNDVTQMELLLEHRVCRQLALQAEAVRKNVSSKVLTTNRLCMLEADIEAQLVVAAEIKMHLETLHMQYSVRWDEQNKVIGAQRAAIADLETAIEFEEEEIKKAKVTEANRKALYRDLNLQKDFLKDERMDLANLEKSQKVLEDSFSIKEKTLQAKLATRNDILGSLQCVACKLTSKRSEQAHLAHVARSKFALLQEQQKSGYPFVQIDCIETAVEHTPLLSAAVYGNIEAVTALLQMKANAHYQALDGNSLLTLAVFGGHIRLIKRLFDEHANVLTESTMEYLLNDAHTRNGLYPLHIAAAEGNIRIVAMLLQAKSHPNVTDNMGISPLIIAARCGSAQIVTKLQEHGATVSDRTTGAVHSAAIHLAVRFGHNAVLNALLFPSKMTRTATTRSEASAVVSVTSTASNNADGTRVGKASLLANPLGQLFIQESRTNENEASSSFGALDSYPYTAIQLAVVCIPCGRKGAFAEPKFDSLLLPSWKRRQNCFDTIVNGHWRAFELTNGRPLSIDPNPSSQGSQDQQRSSWGNLSHAAFLAAEFGDFLLLQRLAVDGYLNTEARFLPFSCCPAGCFGTASLRRCAQVQSNSASAQGLTVLELLRLKFNIDLEDVLGVDFDILETDPGLQSIAEMERMNTRIVESNESDEPMSHNTRGGVSENCATLNFEEICCHLRAKQLHKEVEELAREEWSRIKSMNNASDLKSSFIEFSELVECSVRRFSWSQQFSGDRYYFDVSAFAASEFHDTKSSAERKAMLRINVKDISLLEHVIRSFVVSFRALLHYKRLKPNGSLTGLSTTPNTHRQTMQSSNVAFVPATKQSNVFVNILLRAAALSDSAGVKSTGLSEPSAKNGFDEDCIAAKALLVAVLSTSAHVEVDSRFDAHCSTTVPQSLQRWLVRTQTTPEDSLLKETLHPVKRDVKERGKVVLANGMTALMVAVRLNYLRCVRILLQLRAQPNAKSYNSTGQTALHEALHNVNIVRILLAPPSAAHDWPGGPVPVISRQEALNQSHDHLMEETKASARLVRDAAADPLQPRESDGATPLLLASNRKNAACLRVMLDFLCSVPPSSAPEYGSATQTMDGSETGSRLNATTGSYDWSLNTASGVLDNDEFVLADGISTGLALDSPCPKFGEFSTPLVVACANNFGSAVSSLLHATANPNACTHRGLTPLYACIMRNCAKVAQQVLAAKADPNRPCPARYYDRMTPLRKAAAAGHAGCAKLLLQAGALPDLCGRPGLALIDCGAHEQTASFVFVYESLLRRKALPMDPFVAINDMLVLSDEELAWGDNAQMSQDASARHAQHEMMLANSSGFPLVLFSRLGQPEPFASITTGAMASPESDDCTRIESHQGSLASPGESPTDAMIALLHGHRQTFELLVCGGSDLDALCPIGILKAYIQTNFLAECLPQVNDQLCGLTRKLHDTIRLFGHESASFASCSAQKKSMGPRSQIELHPHECGWSIDRQTDLAVGNSPARAELESLRHPRQVRLSVSDLARCACHILSHTDDAGKQEEANNFALNSFRRILLSLKHRQMNKQGICFSTRTTDMSVFERFTYSMLTDNAVECRRSLYVDGFVPDGVYNFGPLLEIARTPSIECSRSSPISKLSQSEYFALIHSVPLSEAVVEVTPLFAAAGLGRVAVCRALLQHGVSVDIPHRPPLAFCRAAATLRPKTETVDEADFTFPGSGVRPNNTVSAAGSREWKSVDSEGGDVDSVGSVEIDGSEDHRPLVHDDCIEFMRREAWTPLLAASQLGYGRIVWLLLIHDFRAEQQRSATARAKQDLASATKEADTRLKALECAIERRDACRAQLLESEKARDWRASERR